jgi:hypothetical protein
MRRILFAVFAIVVILFVWFYTLGGQHWLAIQTGTDYCVNLPPKYNEVCQRYGFWSGFGSVIPWSLLSLGGLLSIFIAQIRHINCHEKGCVWIGRYPIAGGEFKYCGKHHPDWKGKHPTREHIICRHEIHKAQHIGGGQ